MTTLSSMHHLNSIVDYCNTRLSISTIKDFPGAFNGLQFECTGPIRKIAAMVDASLSSIEKAIAAGAHLILAHHGLFWNPERAIVGSIYEKYKRLIQANCALYSAHLPLDAHGEIGNNALIAKALELEIEGRCFNHEGTDIGVIARAPKSRLELEEKLRSLFPQSYKAISYGSETPERIAICSGSGASVVPGLIPLGIDTLITGELRQTHFTQAQEERLSLYPCGHYATEVFGVKALAKELSEKFNLPWEFIDQPCIL